MSGAISLEFDPIGFVSDSMAAHVSAKLYGRGANDEIAGWSDMVKTVVLGAGVEGSAQGVNLFPFEFGQFIFTRDSFPFGIPTVSIVEPGTSTARRGGQSLEFDIAGMGRRGLKLPVLSSALFEAVPSPTTGMLAYNSDLGTVCLYNGADWLQLEKTFLDVEVNMDAGDTTGLIAGAGYSPGVGLALGNDGLFKPVALPDADIVSVKYPPMGTLVFREDEEALVVFDGSAWREFSATTTTLGVSTETPDQGVDGLAVGTEEKNLNAALEVVASDKGVGLPVASIHEVRQPLEGLIVFDPEWKAICLFDGNGWYQLTYH